MSKLKYADIPKFTGTPNYRVNVSWAYLEECLKQYNVDLDPDFQRGHVWTREHQIAFVEFRLKGGMTGKDIYLNNPNRDWPRHPDTAVVVDGKQRLTAVRAFMNNELPIFGGYYRRDIDHPLRFGMEADFIFHINDLKTRAEVLRWYLELNSGGVIHSKEELARVRALLDSETGLLCGTSVAQGWL